MANMEIDNEPEGDPEGKHPMNQIKDLTTDDDMEIQSTTYDANIGDPLGHHFDHRSDSPSTFADCGPASVFVSI